MSYKFYLILLLLSPGLFLQAQTGPGDPLQEYIKQGIENNLSLKQKQSDWKEAGRKLEQAKGLFYPDISFNARYSVADGGRIIEFPVGDLLNPVYSTLNMLTASDDFPPVENEEFPFLRPKEHETKLRLVQPILNTDIFYNREIQENTLDIRFMDVQSYKRSLVFEIKQAYYNYMKTLEILQLLQNTSSVLEENLRVSKSLFGNDKVTRDVVLRSESEISALEENIAAAEGSRRIARAYFNFLLNRDLEEDILASAPGLPEVPMNIESITDQALTSREELKKLEHFSRLAENNLQLNRADRYPEIFAVVDYGFQGDAYRFTGEDDFVMASVILKWDLFKGLQERSEIAEARIMEEKVAFQQEEARKKIRLEVINNWHELYSSVKKLEASQANAETASEVFRIVNKRYSQNQASLLEFLDARNNMTRARQNMIINTWDTMIRYAALEKAAGFYDLDPEP